ncbi:hypothetical protein CLOM_g13075 [Closterium sp. NIES-68]|nr:hypothetical protein CLOM_g13075 [Closterium sp. NIES-68]GJP64761.1 hypothetical protein CLOP_g21712 [Closterium sp. NIES-67]
MARHQQPLRPLRPLRPHIAPSRILTPTLPSSSLQAPLALLLLSSILLLGAHLTHAAAPSSSSAAALATPTPTKCDMSVGEWRYSKNYPRYVSCPYVRSIFNCRGNGRPDRLYEKQRWVPDKCSLPRFSAKAFLAQMRGKTVGFVGDSLMSNMWESFVCLLYASGVNLRVKAPAILHIIVALSSMGFILCIKARCMWSRPSIDPHCCCHCTWQLNHHT